MAIAQVVNDIEYELVIGLEVHAQLLTASKMFCRCSADYAGALPNTHCCPVCMGFPGALPVINAQAVDYTIMTALALNCTIPEFSKFDRKNYFYPDLPKGYQISQYDIPLSHDGYLTLHVDDTERRIGITRVHLEEDTGRHLERSEAGERYSLIDFNRSGVPWMEIVGEPDLRSPVEARLYMEKLHTILVSLGVSSGKLEDGALRCDANVSVRPRGQQEFGVKTEIKNMNSYRAVERAIAYEAQRQVAALQAGQTIHQETRGWVEERGVTVSQRSKEYAHDYRYFPEPDLPPLFVERAWVAELRARLPELPDARRTRYMEAFGLGTYDAEALSTDSLAARFFEDTVRAGADAKKAADWIQNDVARLRDGPENGHALQPKHLAELIRLVDDGVIGISAARQVLPEVQRTGKSPRGLVEQMGLAQASDTSALQEAARAPTE